MKLNRLLCAGVCGAVLLAGLSACAPEAPQADPDDIAYQAAGISRDTVLFTVDGTEVTADEYLFWLLQSVAAAKQSGYLTDDNAWEEEINGTPTAEYLREDALNTSILYTTVANHAAAEGITLSQEDEDAMDTELETLTQNLDTYYGMTYQEYLDQQCISDAAFRKLNSVAYLAQDLQAALEERGEFEAGEADLDAMIEEAGYTRAKHILLAFPTNEDGSAATDEQKAAVLEEANQLLAQIRAAADPAAEFDAVMNQRSDDGRDENGDLYMPEGYTFYGDGYLADGTGALVSEFVNAAKALAVGEISDPVETSYGYHILMREDFTDEERQQLRDSMASIYPNYAMNQRNEEWIAEAVVETTPAYEALDPHAFYVNMAEMAQAWQAEREAEQAAQATASPAAESETPAAETETPAAESRSPAPAETSSAE